MSIPPPVADIDVLIVGAGAAGLTAALAAHEDGAKVMIVDKGDRLGGTASISGGIVWAPKNPQMAAAGVDDSPDAAMAYFLSLDQGEMEPPRLRAFVEGGAEALAFLEDAGATHFNLLPGYPDYYLDRPGAKPDGGRALDNELFDFRSLGEWADRVYNSGDIPRMMLRETPLGGGAGQVAPEEMERRVNRDLRGWGQALIGRLLKACLDRGVEPLLGARAKRLQIKNGEVTGALVETDGDVREIVARRGVILATGGFEWNDALKSAFLRGPLTTPASPPGNTGDGLKMAMAAGAGLAGMPHAWWMPTLSVEGSAWPANGDRAPDATDAAGAGGVPRHSPVLIERTMPHSIMVNRAGRRFCNEANNYSSLGGAFHVFDPETYDYPNNPAWLILDQQYRSRYPIASVMPGAETPDWIKSAETLADLAASIDIDPRQLENTVAAFNRRAADDQDPQFGRGQSEYDRFYGDRSRPGAAATLGGVEQAPFYAVKISLGALGTNGGPRTDVDGRILDVEGDPIPGLFGAGNVISSPTGSVYAGAGGTLGPALTYGYLAGRAAARLTNR